MMSYKDLIETVFNDSKISEQYSFSESIFIEDIMTTITEREALVLYKRFAFNGYDFCTLKAIGLDFGVTGNRIRQIESKALRKLKHPSRNRCMRENRRMAEIQEENRQLAIKRAKEDQIERELYYKQHNISIDEFNFACRTRNCLMNSNIRNISDLLRWSEKELLKLPNFGRRSLNEIKGVLANIGLELEKD